jgi:hypothetical protein
MSLSAAIAAIVILDVALLGFLAWMMSHPRHLAPHVSRHERATAHGADHGPDVILERVRSG